MTFEEVPSRSPCSRRLRSLDVAISVTVRYGLRLLLSVSRRAKYRSGFQSFPLRLSQQKLELAKLLT